MATAAAKPAAAAPAEAPAKKSKLMLIVILAVALLAGGAGGGWFFMKSKSAATAGDEESAAPKVSNKPAVFLPLDQFTVNLQREGGIGQFLQVAITLKVGGNEVSDAIKSKMPEVRNRVLLLLSGKKPSQVNTPDGKLDLADEVALEIEDLIAPPPPRPARRSRKGADDEAEAAEEKSDKGTSRRRQAESVRATVHVQEVLFTHFIVQ